MQTLGLSAVLVTFTTLYSLTVADDSWVILPSKCEVCKFLVTELRDRLKESGKYKKVIETGHGLESKKKIRYDTSELRLTEALQEPHICNEILKYNLHKEKKGSLRFDKKQSETMKTLHGLKDRGVDVKMDIPYELWDEPSAEVTDMQRKCFSMVEDYEDDIEEWYYHHQNIDLSDYICAQRVLKQAKASDECLKELDNGLDEDKETSKDKTAKGTKEKMEKNQKKDEL